MILSRVRLKQNTSVDDAYWDQFANGYDIHRTVWSLFTDHPDRNRDFLYRIDSEGKAPTIYTLSAREPLAAEALWEIATKPFDPQLEEGERLAFRVRVNPVVTRAGKRHDVVMDAKRRISEEDPGFSYPEAIHHTTYDWLAKRGETHGFKLVPDRFGASGYRQHELRKNGGRPIRLSSADLAGELVVTEPERFIPMLQHGIGPAKGFGMGLMMVRRT